MNFRPSSALSKLKADPIELAGIAVAAGLTLIFIFGLLAPMALNGRLAIARAEAAARQHQQANAVKNSIRAANEGTEQLRNRLAASPLKIRPPSALNERLAVVIALAGQCEVTVKDFKPGEAVRGKRFATIPIHLSGRGSYPNVALLLRRLHEELPDVAVASFKVMGSPDEAGATGRCELELRWFASLSDGPLPQIAAAAPQ